jgi:hypothetical protein
MEPLERQASVLEAVRRVSVPLVRLLIDEGIGYQRLMANLKPVFIEQALAQLADRDEKPTDSAASLRSGIHRKDVSAWRASPVHSSKAVKRSIPAEVFARWISDPAYRNEGGSLRELPRSGPAPSFESLARSVNQDVHPLSVLNELIRLGLAEMRGDADGERVALLETGFVPRQDWTNLLELFVDNLTAHLEVAAHNLRGEGPPQLEQAVYAGGLTPESARQLADLSRQLWAAMMNGFLAEATRLHARDQGRGDRMVRLGAYFHESPGRGEQAER